MSNNYRQAAHKRNSFRDHSAEINLFVRRALVSFLFILILTGILFTAIYNLQVVRYNDYSTRSNGNRIKIIPIPPDRGLIYDRNGVPLSVNQTIYQLEINPDKVGDLNQLFEELRPIVDLNENDITTFYKERKTSRRYTFVTLKSKLTEEQIARFVVLQHKFPFVEINGYQHRYYPYGPLLTHVVGYVSKINDQDIKRLTEENRLHEYQGTKNIGKLGIERYYENILHGNPGYEEVEVDSRGRAVRRLSEKQPTVGNDIYLTLDLKLQEYIAKLLENRRAAVVVMDPKNGEILAMVSSPSYDPNPFVDGISTKDYQALLNDPNKPLYNRTTQGTYPPGSTIKPFIAISALASGVINKNFSIFDIGWWQIPKTERRFRDWKRTGHGSVNIIRSIESSVDTFYYQTAYNMGIDRLSEWMTKFGFGQYSGIDLSQSEQQQGIMPTREWKMARYKKPWLQGDTIPVGIGQGYWTATPIQLVKALTTVINNGNVKTPHLLLNTVNNGVAADYEQSDEKNIDNVNNEFWQIAKQGMYNVINGTYGTARRIFAQTPYKAAGKSGTSQVYGLKKDEVYNAKKIPEHLRDHALFIAYAPYQDPSISLSIIIENAGSGSSNGGAIVRKILDYIFLDKEDLSIDESTTNTGRVD